ncbi:MAG: polysaccharide deacetylase family protein [Paenibacillus sp.]|jgi:peptidoglycan/xylan/chitin deacetylase (PgdA/CDA1 family)|nr:polysaccharide deacetylase family protein [Paenibacillus sp.]
MVKSMLVGFLMIWIMAAAGVAGCGSKKSDTIVSSPEPSVQSSPEVKPSIVPSTAATPEPRYMVEHTSDKKSEPNHDDASLKHTPAATENPAAPSAPVLPTPAPTPKSKETAKVIRIPVLNYHSIGIQPGNNAVLSPKNLEDQMNYLAKEGYTTLSMRQFIDIWEGRLEAPSKSVLLTFDDGYADNHQAALPILKKHNFKAVLFMSPGSVGDGWYVDWTQAKELHEAGWDIQPHGMTHPYLNKLSVEKQKAEIEEAARLIEENLGIRAEMFCYPYGVYNKDTLKILTDNRYKIAFTIDQGVAETTQNPLTLKRLFIGGSDSLPTFINKLTKN